MNRIALHEDKIIDILNEADETKSLIFICKKYGISQSTFYKWRSIYTNNHETQKKNLILLEKQHENLNKNYQKTCLERQILQESLEGKL